MKRFASVTFDGALAASERDAALQSLRSAAALVTSWSGEPPLVVLRVTPRDADRTTALMDVLAGAGRPLGVTSVVRETSAVVVAFAPRITSLGLIVALVDATLGHAPERTIEPLLPLDDETLCAFAGEVLGEPDLDASRLIETYLEPMLARGRS